jgi:hypothetical protein
VKVFVGFILLQFTAIAGFAQGQVVFANKVGTLLDAPVTITSSNPITGPGSGYTAQLFLQEANGALTPLVPTSTFYPPGTSGAAVIADRYWIPQIVDVPGVPAGSQATFVVRAWLTSAGSYEAANLVFNGAGQSSPFSVTLGGGLLPPANLTTLQSFTVTWVPEPSVVALGITGAAALVLLKKRRATVSRA